MTKVYQRIASALQVKLNCERTGNTEWRDRHCDTIHRLVRDFLPTGSGFDWGTGIDYDQSTPNRLVFTTRFHHMNDMGYYDGTTDHIVVVTASLAHGFNVVVKGRDRNGIKDYIGDCFWHTLNAELTNQQEYELARA